MVSTTIGNGTEIYPVTTNQRKVMSGIILLNRTNGLIIDGISHFSEKLTSILSKKTLNCRETY